MNRKTFTFRSSWFEAVRNQPDDIRLALFDAITRYAFYGEIPTLTNPVVEVAFTLIRAEIDAAPRQRTRRQDPASQQQPSEATPQTETDVRHDIAPAVTDRPDRFDEAYDDIAGWIKRDPQWQYLIQNETGNYNLDLGSVLSEFKNHIQKHGKTEEFTSATPMTQEDFILLLTDALASGNFRPTGACST